MQEDSTPTAARNSLRYEALDGWRGIAALLVAVFHFQVASHFYFLPLIRNSYLMVDFFFVLSGLVISHAYFNKLYINKQIGIFFFRRIGRIWPMHVTMLATFVFAETLLFLTQNYVGQALPRPPFSAERNLASIPSNFLLLNGISNFQFGTWNGPSWSVSAELWINLLFALCVISIPKRLISPAIFSLMAGCAVTLAAFSPTYLDSKDAFSLARCGYGFFLGYFVWKAITHNRFKIPGPSFGTILEIFTISFAAIAVSMSDININQMFMPFIFAMFVFVFANNFGAVSNFMQKRFFLTLGRLSYSIYITHFFVAFCLYNAIRVGGKIMHIQSTAPNTQLALIGNSFIMDLVTGVYLCILFLVAYFANKYIEIPAMRWFNARAKKMQAGRIPAQASG